MRAREKATIAGARALWPEEGSFEELHSDDRADAIAIAELILDTAHAAGHIRWDERRRWNDLRARMRQRADGGWTVKT